MAHHHSPDFLCLWRPWIVTHFGPSAPQNAHCFFVLRDPQPLASTRPTLAPPLWSDCRRSHTDGSGGSRMLGTSRVVEAGLRLGEETFIHPSIQ